MNFYNNFLSLCNSAGKKPSPVVLEIGLKKSAVTRWKNGGMPTDATLAKIAEYFNVSIDVLLAENAEKPAPVKDELDIDNLIDAMSREELIEFIMKATAKLKDME